jgi:hypothetical protein
MEVSALLYSTIVEIGKERIQSDVAFDIKQSKHYFELIMNNCKRHIDVFNEDTIGSLCEALLHFMLTVSILPSMRKVVFNGTALDIVIPNLHTLNNSPNSSLVIQFSKESESIIQAKFNDTRKVQPNENNLWIISENPLSFKCINYTVNPKQRGDVSTEKRIYSDLIIDIDRFLREKGDKSLRIFQ